MDEKNDEPDAKPSLLEAAPAERDRDPPVVRGSDGDTSDCRDVNGIKEREEILRRSGRSDSDPLRGRTQAVSAAPPPPARAFPQECRLIKRRGEPTLTATAEKVSETQPCQAKSDGVQKHADARAARSERRRGWAICKTRAPMRMKKTTVAPRLFRMTETLCEQNMDVRVENLR